MDSKFPPASTTGQGLQAGDSLETLAELQEVYKRFGRVEALRGVSLKIGRGEILALLGPNGAGKTTAISLLLGRRAPDRGKALLFDRNPRQPEARRRIGATPQETGFPWVLTAKEILELVRAHFPNARSMQSLLEQFGLLELQNRQAGGLSGGQQRKLAVALAFAGDPQIVFLDEPTTGLDVEARRTVWQAVRRYRENGGTVLLTTHYLEEAEALASRAAIIHQGTIIADGEVEAIKRRASLKRVRFQAGVLPDLPGVVRIEQENGMHTLYTPDSDRLVRALVQGGVDFENLEVLPASLEEAFLEVTGGEQ